MNVTLFGKRVFVNVIKDLERKSFWIIHVDSKSNGSVCIREIKRRGLCEDRSRDGVMQPQAKEHVEPPKAGKMEEGFFPSLWRKCSK